MLPDGATIETVWIEPGTFVMGAACREFWTHDREIAEKSEKVIDSVVKLLYIDDSDIQRCRSTVLYLKPEGVMTMDGPGGLVAAGGVGSTAGFFWSSIRESLG